MQILEDTIFTTLAHYPEPRPCGTPPAMLLQALRCKIFSYPMFQKNQFKIDSKHLLVLKRKHSRSVTNHNQLLNALQDKFVDFHITTHLGNEPVIEQLQMFYNSDVIVAPHGAGLSNIVACRPQTIVVEFMPAYPHVNICYMSMAFKLGLYYVSIAVQNADQYNPMTVDVLSVVNTLQDAINTKKNLRHEATESVVSASIPKLQF